MAGREQITAVEGGLLVLAPAKINLSLLIAGKRPDGFHEIETIMAKVNWYDEILIQAGRKPGVELICKGPHWAPKGRENLVHQAAARLLESCGSKAGLKVTLTKNIPAGTGLGSASSDAAATLIGLNRHLDLGWDKERLSELAATLGSDVAFFLNGPLAFCTGRGEKVEKIDGNFDFLALLILPDISVSTKEVYANYRPNRGCYEKLSVKINSHIKEKRIDLAVAMCANMLQETCFGLAGSLAELKGKIESLGMRPCCLSGSGSAFFCISESGDEDIVRRWDHTLETEIGCKSVIVRNSRW
ncbi:MAG: 4-(cytidine 5'-diphospho)-2-C-methyl-D-erythritol kinase [Phycisphaerales bacterium]|nr:MAG: 4-(cytidine 5'-diphospho)-2-C-methyl-D-erythritol kinase [Phycisphaerales bacterium]